MITHQELRQSFLDFYKAKGHRIVPSAPLIPQGDPTILFTNAGMNPFKDIFLGHKAPPIEKRICDAQKCIRLSGKHNDLEEVGKDTYHHAFFEMLGSWSFGDYYKREAIAWAWELLTKVWKLPKTALYATVYQDDDEAYALWPEVTELPVERVFRFDAKDNFWEMGKVGPCGPCSEIHIDIGEENCSCRSSAARTRCRRPGGGVNQDCGRYIEIWNLVFIQYNREADGSLKPLAHKHVDTGMGFERIVAILQNKTSNYETDLFTPLIQALSTLSGQSYPLRNVEIQSKTAAITAKAVAFRVIVDHLRAISFAIGDDVVPSNEGRGYVIRRLIRRAYRYGQTLGLTEPFLHKLVTPLGALMGGHYETLLNKAAFITETILHEERTFAQTLSLGEQRFKKLIASYRADGSTSFPGKDAFELYDTYGFPLDLIKLMTEEVSFTLDESEFTAAMAEQKSRSRSMSRLANAALETNLAGLRATPTKYIGDTASEHVAPLLRIILNGKSVTELSPAQTQAAVLLYFPTTPFYGEAGGQVGDTGWLLAASASSAATKPLARVTTALRSGGLTLIAITELQTPLSVQTEYKLKIDKVRRQALRQNHSATHLLQQALVDTLGAQLHQCGSLVSPEKLRFDFNHPSSITIQELTNIEKAVNTVINANLAVTTTIETKETALKSGAKAFFEEKYGDQVRVVRMGTYSTELCGGSHVYSTSEIGGLKIMSVTAIASGIKRIEAITGAALQRFYATQSTQLETLAQLLKTPVANLTAKTTALLHEHNRLLSAQQELQTTNVFHTLQTSKQQLHKANFYHGHFKALPPTSLLQALDRLKHNDKQAVICITHEATAAKASFWLAIGQTLTARLSAVTLMNTITQTCAGTGGGKRDFAQGGTRQVQKLKQALPDIPQALCAAIKQALA